MVAAVRHVARKAVFDIVIDGRPPLVRSGQAIMVCNLGRLPFGLVALPEAEPDDGVMEVVVLRIKPLADLPKLAAKLLLRRPASGMIERLPARSVVVDAHSPLPIENDGEVVDTTNHLAVHIVPLALTLCVPPPR